MCASVEIYLLLICLTDIACILPHPHSPYREHDSTMAKLLFVALSSLIVLATAHDEVLGQRLRRVNEVEVDQSHRDLSGWGFASFSWTNLLCTLNQFARIAVVLPGVRLLLTLLLLTDQAHICHTPPSSCPESSNGICKCPDCSKKLIPPHLHSYCKYVNGGSEEYEYSAYGGEDGEDGGDGVDGEYGGGSSDRQYQKDGDSQGASRMFKPWLVILTGSLVAAGTIGAVLYRRVSRKTDCEMWTPLKPSNHSGLTRYLSLVARFDSNNWKAKLLLIMSMPVPSPVEPVWVPPSVSVAWLPQLVLVEGAMGR